MAPRKTYRTQLVADALLEARGFVFAQAIARVGGIEAVRPLLTKLEAAYGATIERTNAHDAGAVARCSFCGRYTSNHAALSDLANTRAPCDCGQLAGWSGSFVAPTEESQWSIGVNRR